MKSFLDEIINFILSIFVGVIIYAILVAMFGVLMVLPTIVITMVGFIFVRPFLNGKRSLLETFTSLCKFFCIHVFKLLLVGAPTAGFVYFAFVLRDNFKGQSAFDPIMILSNSPIIAFIAIIGGITIYVGRSLYADKHPWDEFKDALRGTY